MRPIEDFRRGLIEALDKKLNEVESELHEVDDYEDEEIEYEVSFRKGRVDAFDDAIGIVHNFRREK